MRVKKNPEIPDGRGSSQNPSGMEIMKGWRVKMKKPSLVGYRFFLELHIK